MTKQERNKIYKRLLKDVCSDKEVLYGICLYLPHDINVYELPELYKHEPIRLYPGGRGGIYGYWAPCNYKGWERRIRWIEKAINDTK